MRSLLPQQHLVVVEEHTVDWPTVAFLFGFLFFMTVMLNGWPERYGPVHIPKIRIIASPRTPLWMSHGDLVPLDGEDTSSPRRLHRVVATPAEWAALVTALGADPSHLIVHPGPPVALTDDTAASWVDGAPLNTRAVFFTADSAVHAIVRHLNGVNPVESTEDSVTGYVRGALPADQHTCDETCRTPRTVHY